MSKLSRIILLSLFSAVLCGGAVYAALQLQSNAPSATLASFAPPGALLAIESPNFSALLKSWNDSPEQKHWLASNDYAGFSRSRLFTRLGQAQDEFATTAGLAPDTKFLQQVAGSQSLFAWYDIGNLEFLYITQLPAGEAAKTPLLQIRSKFEERKSGDTTFYVKTTTDPSHTVAFAVRGDYLLLATREDLLANALALMQQPAERTLQHESWYAATVTAAPKQTGDLRMTLNLAKIVPSPYFRSYWIQQNITELKQYTAALSDLYCTPSVFREERVLLPTDHEAQASTADLSPVLDYLPTGLGVYRAQAQPSTAEVLAQLEDKLLSRQPGTNGNTHIMPVANLSTPISGDASDFEQRIDAPPVIAQPRAAALTQLTGLITSAAPSAMLSFSSTTNPKLNTEENVFVPIHNAIALAATAPWDPTALQQALSTALSPRLSIGAVGLTWTEHHNAASSWFEMSDMKGLVLFVHGNICILASDQPTLLQLLAAVSTSSHKPAIATTIAGFNHTSEQPQFMHLTAILDHSEKTTQPADGSVPPFFSGNMASLSQAFQALDAETFTESVSSDHSVHQTVLYQWRH